MRLDSALREIASHRVRKVALGHEYRWKYRGCPLALQRGDGKTARGLAFLALRSVGSSRGGLRGHRWKLEPGSPLRDGTGRGGRAAPDRRGGGGGSRCGVVADCGHE